MGVLFSFEIKILANTDEKGEIRWKGKCARIKPRHPFASILEPGTLAILWLSPNPPPNPNPRIPSRFWLCLWRKPGSRILGPFTRHTIVLQFAGPFQSQDWLSFFNSSLPRNKPLPILPLLRLLQLLFLCQRVASFCGGDCLSFVAILPGFAVFFFSTLLWCVRVRFLSLFALLSSDPFSSVRGQLFRTFWVVKSFRNNQIFYNIPGNLI